MRALAFVGMYMVCSYAICSDTSALDMKFQGAISKMGGSVLEPLLDKLNDISDSDVNVSGRAAKAELLERISGHIGPIEYTQKVRTKTITSYGPIGRFEGVSTTGILVQGDIMGTTTSTRTKVSNYMAIVPPAFMGAFQQLLSNARSKHPRSCAEVGACIFVEATKGQMGMNDRRAFDFFKKAAEQGDVDGMYMYAFCLYYGIGCSFSKPDKVKAAAAIRKLRDELAQATSSKSACSRLVNRGWLARRLSDPE